MNEKEDRSVDPIEKIIQQAQERGDFDNLPGAGKPLDLRENPFVPPDWQMAYRMLSNSGYAPDVVESDKALRAGISALDGRLSTFVRRWESWRRTPGAPTERNAQLVARQKFLQEYEEEIRAINSQIHSFNVMAPRAMTRGTLHVARMLADAEARLLEDG
jgi:DnaJ family protein C protein 28